MINPRYEPTFWSYAYSLPLFDGDKRCWSTPGPLPALAALVPDGCTVELLDENVRAIDWDDLRRFDVIGLTGMVVQRDRMFAILGELRKLPATIAVGGPYVSVAERAFEGRCDVRFIGEAEDTWPVFLRALANGEPTLERYEQTQKTDMTRAPVPRFDLLEMDRYMSASVQFSRGCPFQCEFCDIITIFGRRPRLKTPEQFLREIEAVHRSGARVCFLVDDNFIGNRNVAKTMLPLLIAWQRENGFPLQFSTEASVDLADEPELMELMVQANFRQVFIGLESPRASSLNETKKFQNTRGDSMLDKIARVRDAGLVVQAGFIVGFDNDDMGIFEEQFAFIEASGIAQAAVGILSPIPTTPLFDRLEAAGRLDESSDPEVFFIPAQMTQRQLREEHAALVRRLYEPQTYLGRVFHGYRSSPAFRRRRAELEAEIGLGLGKRILRTLGALRLAVRLGRMMLRRSLFGRLAPAFVRVYLRDNLALGRNAMPLYQYVTLCVTSWHFFNIAQRERKEWFGNAVAASRVPVAAGD